MTHAELIKLHGRKITCVIDETVINNAKISVSSDQHVYVCQNLRDGFEAYDKLGYDYSWEISKPLRLYEEWNEKCININLIKKDMDNLEVGDILVDDFKKECKVLGVSGLVYFVSIKGNFEVAFSDPYTLSEIKKLFKLKDAEPEVRATITIGEVTYDKAEFEKATKDLKPV